MNNETQEETQGKATCKHCGAVFTGKNQHGANMSLLWHERRVHKDEPKDEQETPPVAEISEVKEEETPLTDREKTLLEEVQKLRAEKDKDKAILDPESGPGEPCEAYKINMGESWQVHANPEGKFPDPPEGYEFYVRGDANRLYVIPKGTGGKQFIANCKSKYTNRHKVKAREPGKAYPDWEYDEKELPLCEKHAKMFVEGFNP